MLFSSQSLDGSLADFKGNLINILHSPHTRLALKGCRGKGILNKRKENEENRIRLRPSHGAPRKVLTPTNSSLNLYFTLLSALWAL